MNLSQLPRSYRDNVAYSTCTMHFQCSPNHIPLSGPVAAVPLASVHLAKKSKSPPLAPTALRSWLFPSVVVDGLD